MLDTVKRTSVYQPTQVGLKFPEIPSFDSYAEERQHRKERLVAACRAFALQGFDYGFAGHLTIRDPEHTELYWTNPMAIHFKRVKLSNLILVDHDGKVVEGDHAVNRAGFVLHAARPCRAAGHPRDVPRAYGLWHRVRGARQEARADHPGRRGILRGPRRHRRRGRQGRRRGHGGQQGRQCVLRAREGSDPSEPRPVDREPPQHRRVRVLVHRARALLPASS